MEENSFLALFNSSLEVEEQVKRTKVIYEEVNDIIEQVFKFSIGDSNRKPKCAFLHILKKTYPG